MTSSIEVPRRRRVRLNSWKRRAPAGLRDVVDADHHARVGGEVDEPQVRRGVRLVLVASYSGVLEGSLPADPSWIAARAPERAMGARSAAGT